MDIKEAEKIFQSMGNETRIKIFKTLVKYNKVGICSTEIAKQLEIPQNTISFHLTNMKNANLVISNKEGKNVIYKVQNETFEKLQNYLFENCCSVEDRVCNS